MEFFYRSVIIMVIVLSANLSTLYSYVYDQTSGSFTQADKDSMMPLPGHPPDTCFVCAKAAARDIAQALQIIRHGAGVAIGDYAYHLNDYALVKSSEGFCLVGQIVSIKTSNIAPEQMEMESRGRKWGKCQWYRT